MKTRLIFTLASIIVAEALKINAPAPTADVAPKLIPDRTGKTLRQWIENTDCLNAVSLPLVNTMNAQIGTLEALNDVGLLKKITGFAGASAGALSMALAATDDFAQASKNYRELFPGIANMVPSGTQFADPYLSESMTKFMAKVLPQSFSELKTPLAVTASKYANESVAAAAALGHQISEAVSPVVISDGDLLEAVLVSSSAMSGKGCPRCKKGFSAKEFRGHWPVADGYPVDELGTLGLAALKPCPNLLHFAAQHYPQQRPRTKNSDLETEPTNVVTVGIDVHASAISAGMTDLVIPGMSALTGTVGKAKDWEKVEYETAYNHMKEMLDQPMLIEDQPQEEEHYFVDLNLNEHTDQFRSWAEKMMDKQMEWNQARSLKKREPVRAQMVRERNALMKAGKLSFRACGNGLGAPQTPQCKQ